MREFSSKKYLCAIAEAGELLKQLLITEFSLSQEVAVKLASDNIVPSSPFSIFEQNLRFV